MTPKDADAFLLLAMQGFRDAMAEVIREREDALMQVRALEQENAALRGQSEIAYSGWLDSMIRAQVCPCGALLPHTVVCTHTVDPEAC